MDFPHIKFIEIDHGWRNLRYKTQMIHVIIGNHNIYVNRLQFEPQ